MRVLRLPQVRERTGLSKMTIGRLEKAGGFPKRIRLGENSVGWAEHEIEAWLAGKLAERDQAAGHGQ